MSFGERLQSLRRENGMTQETFAAQLKVSRQAVSKWESGRGYPEIEKIIYICNRWGVTPNDLFADEVTLPVPQAEEPPAEETPAPPAELPVRPLRRLLEDFVANLSPGNQFVFGGILIAAALLVLLASHFLKGGSDAVMTIVWTAAIIVFGIVEAVTAGLVCIWFAAGAVAALIAAFVGVPLWAQIGLFVIVSAVALALTRPLLKKITQGQVTPTNADRVLGQTAKVTETIDNENYTGAVYVDGKTWTARSADGSVIPAGSRVKIEKMQGVKLLVSPVEKTEEVN